MNESVNADAPPIVALAEDLWKDAHANMRPHHKEWLEAWKYYNGDHWPKKRPEGAFMASANVMGALVNQSVAHQTTSRPSVVRTPLVMNQQTIDGCDLLNKVDPIMWEEQKLQNTFEQGLLNVQLCRWGMLQRYYDKRANKRMGGYRIKNRSPFTIFPDPCLKSDDFQNDQDYMFTAEPVPISYIRRHWPDKAREVYDRAGQSDMGDEDILKHSSSGGGEMSPHSVTTYTPGGETPYTIHPNIADRADGEGRKKVTLKTMYVRQDFVEVEHRFYRGRGEGHGKITNEKITTDWRVVNYVDGMLLSDESSQFYDGELPFIHLTTGTLPDSFMTYNECKQLIPLQRAFNLLLSLIIDHTLVMANPDVFISSQSGLSEKWLKKLNDGYRKYIKVRGNASGAVSTNRPANLGPEVGNMLEYLVRLMEMIIAMPEILQGERPAGAKSGEALKVLTAQAMPRSNKKTQRYEECVKETVEKVMLDYLVGLPYVVNKVSNGEMFRFRPGDLIDLAITTEVMPGSSLPSYQDMKMERIISFAQAMQGMDPMMQQLMLQNADIPELRGLLGGQGMQIGGQPVPGGINGAMQIPLNIEPNKALEVAA